MAEVGVSIGVNGKWYEMAVEPYETLLDVLRNKLGMTGTKMGCGQGECGACTVNIDGKAVLSCLTLAVQADGKEILIGYDDQKPSTTDNVVAFVVSDNDMPVHPFWDLCDGILE